MTITSDSTLTDVAFAACTALRGAGETAILCGGSAATFYVPERYQSYDADFILRSGGTRRIVDRALASIGFQRDKAAIYRHHKSSYVVEFPPGPLAIGRKLVNQWDTVVRANSQLFVLFPIDVVCDRFLHFWAWGDTSARTAALDIAAQYPERIDITEIETWLNQERAADSTYSASEAARFLEGVQGAISAGRRGR